MARIKKIRREKNNYVLFNNGTTWTQDSVVFRAVKAEHSDENAIGVIISSNNKNYYVTGDTLYSERVFESLPEIPIEAVFLPVNGKGNNMNFADAEKFFQRVGARYIVPVHIGMFDDWKSENLRFNNKISLQIYKKITL